ncbi:hypothetical protein SAMN06264346_101366 [Chryseobacterium profundimaris]|uniref:Transposase n=1 Tax=Chryseobacterium profundimaris TaxID=1387275 RepID=A0ABY1NAN7_9FLAO|nr:hypothetical protein SAMN06264346_101366 [Chryseobacterium profundimaris]
MEIPGSGKKARKRENLFSKNDGLVSASFLKYNTYQY